MVVAMIRKVNEKMIAGQGQWDILEFSMVGQSSHHKDYDWLKV